MKKNTNYIISYAKHISWTILGDEVFVFNELTNEIILLGEKYKALWKSIEKNNRMSEIVAQNSDSVCDENNSIKKVDEWLRKKLIVVEEI